MVAADCENGQTTQPLLSGLGDGNRNSRESEELQNSKAHFKFLATQPSCSVSTTAPLLSGNSYSRAKGEAKHTKIISVLGSDRSHSEFRKNWELSLLMASLICLFFTPLVFKDSIGAVVFGKGCAGGGGICGLLASPDLRSYWPNVVQLMFFTVYLDLGNTVKLAWQGLGGTAAVGLNVYIMALIFPVGGKCKLQGTERLFHVSYGLRTMCGEFEDQTYGRFQWFVWFDVFLVIFLVLASNAEANTKKFALSWHASFMMEFMSPAGERASYSVAFTTIFAVALAILSMLHPDFRLSSCIKTAQQTFSKDFCSVLKATDHFMEQSFSLSSAKRRAVVYDLEHRMKQLIASYRDLGSVYKFSWFENFIMCNRYGTDRSSLEVFICCIGDFQGIDSFVDKALMVMLKAVLAEIDEEHHEQLHEQDKEDLESQRETFIEQVEALHTKVCDCLSCLVDSCAITTASDDAIGAAYDQLKEKAETIKIERKKLEQLMMDAQNKNGSTLSILWPSSIWYTEEKGSPFKNHLRNNLLIYIYACLVISSEACQWPKRWKDEITKFKKTTRYVLMDEHLRFWNAFLALWGDVYYDEKSPWHIKLSEGRYWCPFWVKIWYDDSKRSFVQTNTLAICLVFFLGNVFDGGVWSPYEPGMAATLGVLISNYSGSAIRNNFMRLLGIILGKVTPIMLIAFAVLFKTDPDAPEGGMEAFVHIIVMFLFMAFFANVYYTSPRWSLVGCLTAGFGCYSFASDQWGTAMFADRYREIGQATFAILLQIFIDLVDIAIHKSWARDRVVENLKRIGCESNALDDVETGDMAEDRSLLIQAFHDCFFVQPKEETLNKIAQHSSNLQAIIERQRNLADECGEDTIIVASARGPFKLQLHEDTLPMIEQLKTELDICYLLKYHEVQSDNAILGEEPVCFRSPGLQQLERIILDALPMTFMRLREVLEQAGTEPALEHHMQEFYWTESGVEHCSQIIEVNHLFKPQAGCLVSQEELYVLRNNDIALTVKLLLKHKYITKEETDFNDQLVQLRTSSLPMCVARRSLKDIWRLTCSINHTCFSSGHLRTDFGSKEWP